MKNWKCCNIIYLQQEILSMSIMLCTDSNFAHLTSFLIPLRPLSSCEFQRYVLHTGCCEVKHVVALFTWSLLSSTASVFPPGFAAFQNCFWAE